MMVELLIPAQNIKSIQAAIGNADAIYFGVETFSMRMHAKNIKQTNMRQLVDICHDNNIKAYLTTNIIIYEGELELLKNLIEIARSSEVDALIVHDFATIELAKEYNLPFHISTQASISNSRAAKFYEDLGADSITLARELTLTQIAEIINKLNKTRIQVFIHGAMCTSISGRCYFSQTLSGTSFFSANRGKCIQPCRNEWRVISKDGQELDYNGYFFLNSKDLCMIEYIPELMEAKIHSFKVEGRMRSPRYVEVVSKIYRKAIDEYENGTYTKDKAKIWKKELEKVYNRGFHTGFYFQQPTISDINHQTSGNMATARKIEVGSIITYYNSNKVAKIRFFKGQFKPGDEIYIEGGEMGTYYRHVLSEIFHKNKICQETPDIGSIKDGFVVTIKVDRVVKRGDRVFIYK
ncbi:MAG: U32 family peptidase [Candidatus Lokiarchaeota archaeon]|nr:U32 family peptidase [Candidatus Lokiarchaeota archaeon]